MDAVEFYKAFKRMCDKTDCKDCLLDQKCRPSANVEPEEVIELVEKWAKEHPVKTRQSEFLRRFPNADMQKICTLFPCVIDQTIRLTRCVKYENFSSPKKCVECRNDYWHEEVDN